MRPPLPLIEDIEHRPWPLPREPWVWYQQWNQALFLHWSIPAKALRPLIPKRLEIDTFEGEAWVSVVPFTMNQVRPRFLPSFPPVSDFHEVNLRTYVTDGMQPGVFFLSIHSEKPISTWIAKTTSGLPYVDARISRSPATPGFEYRLATPDERIQLEARYEIGSNPLAVKSPLDRWLTERYCLYAAQAEALYRYEIHHREWPLLPVTLRSLKQSYGVGDLSLSDRQPDHCHYSPGVEVVAWRRLLLP